MNLESEAVCVTYPSQIIKNQVKFQSWVIRRAHLFSWSSSEFGINRHSWLSPNPFQNWPPSSLKVEMGNVTYGYPGQET
jgi:hypothetical protein